MKRAKGFIPLILLAFIGICLLQFLSKPQEQEQEIVREISSQPLTPDFGKLVVNQPSVAPGYVLYPTNGNNTVDLLNLNGEVVHTWAVDAMRARILDDCSLLVVHGTKKGRNDPYWGKLVNTIRKYSWNGEVLWGYTHDTMIHHDIRVTKDGNYIFPVKHVVDADEFAPYRKLPKNVQQVKSDRLIEVNQAGEVQWSWAAFDHLDKSSCGKIACSDLHNKTGWTHMNTVSIIPPNQWYDQGDERFRPGNLIITLRNWWQFLIIDKITNKAVWNYTGDYRGGLSGGHNAYIIPKGLPGAGNILVFDNGRFLHAGESIVLEINPITQEIVWKYEDGRRFFARSSSRAQRLENGNTFISQDSDNDHRVFEVTPSGKIVWEYRGTYRPSRAEKYESLECPIN